MDDVVELLVIGWDPKSLPPPVPIVSCDELKDVVWSKVKDGCKGKIPVLSGSSCCELVSTFSLVGLFGNSEIVPSDD